MLRNMGCPVVVCESTNVHAVKWMVCAVARTLCCLKDLRQRPGQRDGASEQSRRLVLPQT
jgi:hypothetical protein